MTIHPWFERTFDFKPAPSLFAPILERLRGTAARLEERTGGLSTATLVRRDGEHWSIQENVGHLLDLEPLWLRRAEQFFAAAGGGAGELVAADLTNRATFDAGHNARDLRDLLGQFRSARMQLVSLLSRADDATIARVAVHPRLRTPMRLIDHAFFVAEHDDHHLATITSLLEAG